MKTSKQKEDLNESYAESSKSKGSSYSFALSNKSILSARI